MREISRFALVPYTPDQMFALVDDIERYAEFLPWVTSAKVLERTERERTGRVEVSRAGLREQFTSRNTVTPPSRLEMRLLDGPFHMLEGVWTFDAILDPSAGTDKVARGTRIGLALRFEFKSRVTDLLLGPKIASSCDTMVDAFAKRAKEIYGNANAGVSKP